MDFYRTYGKICNSVLLIFLFVQCTDCGYMPSTQVDLKKITKLQLFNDYCYIMQFVLFYCDDFSAPVLKSR